MNTLNERVANAVEDILSEAIREAINGENYQEHLKCGAYETSVWLANHYANITLNRVVKEMPKGKARDTIHNSLELLTHRGIESLCRGASLENIRAELIDCAKGQLKSYLADQSQYMAKEVSSNLYRNLKFTGKGSRKINSHIKSGSNIVGQELSYQIVDNFGAWIDGRKNFGDAVNDVAVNTTKNASVTQVKGQGAELAADALKELTKSAEKKIANELARSITTTALSKVANANTLIQSAGYLIDVGKSLKQLIDGNITKAQ